MTIHPKRGDAAKKYLQARQLHDRQRVVDHSEAPRSDQVHDVYRTSDTHIRVFNPSTENQWNAFQHVKITDPILSDTPKDNDPFGSPQNLPMGQQTGMVNGILRECQVGPCDAADDRWVILQEPLLKQKDISTSPPGAYAVWAGLTWARVDIIDPCHRRVSINPDDPQGPLVTSNFGPAELVWSPQEDPLISRELSLILLDGPGTMEPPLVGTAKEDILEGTTGAVDVTKSTSKDYINDEVTAEAVGNISTGDIVILVHVAAQCKWLAIPLGAVPCQHRQAIATDFIAQDTWGPVNIVDPASSTQVLAQCDICEGDLVLLHPNVDLINHPDLPDFSPDPVPSCLYYATPCQKGPEIATGPDCLLPLAEGDFTLVKDGSTVKAINGCGTAIMNYPTVILINTIIDNEGEKDCQWWAFPCPGVFMGKADECIPPGQLGTVTVDGTVYRARNKCEVSILATDTIIGFPSAEIDPEPLIPGKECLLWVMPCKTALSGQATQGIAPGNVGPFNIVSVAGKPIVQGRNMCECPIEENDNAVLIPTDKPDCEYHAYPCVKDWNLDGLNLQPFVEDIEYANCVLTYYQKAFVVETCDVTIVDVGPIPVPIPIPDLSALGDCCFVTGMSFTYDSETEAWQLCYDVSCMVVDTSGACPKIKCEKKDTICIPVPCPCDEPPPPDPPCPDGDGLWLELTSTLVGTEPDPIGPPAVANVTWFFHGHNDCAADNYHIHLYQGEHCGDSSSLIQAQADIQAWIDAHSWEGQQGSLGLTPAEIQQNRDDKLPSASCPTYQTFFDHQRTGCCP